MAYSIIRDAGNQRFALPFSTKENIGMGFALWIDGETALAAGTHEYRPMGMAVISAGGVFTPRDFRRAHRLPPRSGQHFHGLFASLGDLNHYLVKTRSQPRKKRPPRLVQTII